MDASDYSASNLGAHVELFRRRLHEFDHEAALHFAISEQILGVLEQVWSSFRAVLEGFCNDFGANSGQFSTSFRAIFGAFSEQFRSIFRAILEQILGNFQGF